MFDFNNFFLVSSIVISAILGINIFYLLYKYNKDRVLPICMINEEELLDKHGAIICSCIVQKRSMLPRDIIAVLVDLIQRDLISITLKRTSEFGRMVHEYRLKIVDKDAEFTEIESRVIECIFKESSECLLNTEISQVKKRLETLNLKRLVDKKLEEIGANTVKVSKKVQAFNNLFFILVCIFFVIHLIYSFDSTGFFANFKTNIINWFVVVIKIDALFILFTMLCKMISLLIDRLISRENKHRIEFTDSLILNLFLKCVIANLIVLILLIFAGSNIYFIADIILFDLAMILMVIDELVSNHSPKLNKEYISLIKLAEKLECEEIIDYFSQDKKQLYMKYVPFLIACNLKKVNVSSYIEKLAVATLDMNEKDKYLAINQLLNFEEVSIYEFYFSKDFKRK